MSDAAHLNDDYIFREIAEYTYDWESWMGPDGRVRWVNAAVSRITGHSVEACLSHPDYPLFLVHPDDRARVADALLHARRHLQGNHLEFRILHKQGHVRWGAMSWQDLLDREGRYMGFRTSVRDVTERKRGEEALLRSFDEAQKDSQIKSEFLAHMSHEIRTPIQNIYGLTQVLRRTQLDARQDRFTDTLQSECELLLKIVDDILDFSSLQSATVTLEKEPFSVSHLVATAVAGVEPMAAAKGVGLRASVAPSVDLEVVGDAHRVRQVLGNLLNNAIRFTDQGEVVLRVEPSLEHHAMTGSTVALELSVQDTGIGIERNRLRHLFEPFVQADSSIRRRFGGTGLGLAICKKLVDAMGGTISVRSAPNEGSCFTVSIAFARSATGTPAVQTLPAQPPEQQLPTLRVLVVEDGQVARQVAVELLRILGQEPDIAPNAAEALRLLAEKTFDLVLMDKRMPEMDGLSLTRSIRANPNIVQPYIVAVTANVLPDARQACLQAGMDSFIGKPVKLQSLAMALREAHGRRSDPQNATPTEAGALPSSDLLSVEVVRDLLSKVPDGRTVLQITYAQIARAFDEEVAALVAADRAADWTRVAALAHGLAGSLSQVGAQEGARLARALERHTEGPAGVQIETLVCHVQAVKEALGRLVPDTPEDPA